MAAAVGANVEPALDELRGTPSYRDGVALLLKHLPDDRRQNLVRRLLQGSTNPARRLELAGVLRSEEGSRASAAGGTEDFIEDTADFDDENRVTEAMSVDEGERLSAASRAMALCSESHHLALLQEISRLISQRPHDVQQSDIEAVQAHVAPTVYRELLLGWLAAAQRCADDKAVGSFLDKLHSYPSSTCERVGDVAPTPVESVTAPEPREPTPSQFPVGDELRESVEDVVASVDPVMAATILLDHYGSIPEGARDAAQEAIRRGIDCAGDREKSRLLRAYVEVLQHPRRQQVFEEAMRFAEHIVDADVRAEHLEGMAWFVSSREAGILQAMATEARHPGSAQAAFEKAISIADPADRATEMVDAYPALPPQARLDALERILKTIEEVDRDKRPELLFYLGSVLEDASAGIEVAKRTVEAVEQAESLARRAELYVMCAKHAGAPAEHQFLAKARDAAEKY
ncbi:MAG: hypothetical protein ACREUZ_13950, partial [Burkholderiales bacterium]